VSDRAEAPNASVSALAPLSVETDLSLTVNGAEAAVRSTGERLFVEFESASDAFQALRGLPDGGAGADQLTALLRTTDLTAEVRVRDRTIAVLGSDARAGPLSRRLGVAPAEVRLGGVLGVAGREVAAVFGALAALARTFR
jgi:hypothetical protein